MTGPKVHKTGENRAVSTANIGVDVNFTKLSIVENDSVQGADVHGIRSSGLRLERIFDVAFSVLIILLLSPLLIFVSILIRIETKGVFVRFDGSLPNLQNISGLKFRCTKQGDGKKVPLRACEALRRSGLEMMPLLFSVFEGDISLKEAYRISRMHSQFLNSSDWRYEDVDVAQLFAAKFTSRYPVKGSRSFWTGKRIFDVVMSILLLPLLVVVALGLTILNPFWNRGKLFHVQTRMGKNCQPFTAIKFRSMREVAVIERGPDDPLELNRVTRLGRLIRKLRLDELPQILNVFMGQMSLIGPRPDFYEHAIVFLKTVPGYLERHAVRPGISGLAQINLGYTVGTDATHRKTNTDHAYISNAGLAQEISIFFRTIVTVFSRAGS